MDKNLVENRIYFCFYDKVANDYGEPFKARTNAEALRAFHISLSQQKSKGMIANVEDYKLYKLFELAIFVDGSASLFVDIKEVIDNEQNNSEE